jgi:hypothetical protein
MPYLELRHGLTQNTAYAGKFVYAFKERDIQI